MTNDESGDEERGATSGAGEPAGRAEDAAPQTQRDEGVRVRVADEIERRERGYARRDPHGLDPGGDEHRPQNVRELAGREQQGERELRRRAFRGEGEREVSDEHRAFYGASLA